jgi:hypothetical protein
MLLIYPPVAKPCEPPGGIARLHGALTRHGVKCHTLDANLEGLLFLLSRSKDLDKVTQCRWTGRAARNLYNHLDLLRSRAGYENIDRFKRAVTDLNHLLGLTAKQHGVQLSLSDYQDVSLSPLKSADLILSAKQHEKNPFYGYFQSRLPALLDKDGSDMVGISIQYLSQALCAFALIGMIRRLFPGVRIVLGGGLVTSWMKRRAWQNPFAGLVDDMIAGPGEDALLTMNGIQTLDSSPLACPDYNPFPMKDYLAPGKVLPYSASSGCHWRKCSFCPEKTEGGAFIPVPPERVIRDLQLVVKDMGPAIIHFLDNGLTPALMKAISVSPPGAPWYGFARMTSPLVDPDFCMALKNSGCVMLKLGLESGSQNVLDGLHKGIEIQEASKILHNLKKAGIATYVYLLFGTPEEGEAEARQTLDFVVSRHECIQYINVALFNLPADHPDASGMNAKPFSDADLPLYADFIHPKGWDRKTVRRFLDKEFTRKAEVAAILRRTPPSFTSNHAPFFHLSP